jgi:hypothetical protein
MNLPHDYDDWRLSGPDDIHQPYVGTEDGEECNRIGEPDEDAPRGYRPKPCTGEMIEDDGVVMCCKCGGVAE